MATGSIVAASRVGPLLSVALRRLTAPRAGLASLHRAAMHCFRRRKSDSLPEDVGASECPGAGHGERLFGAAAIRANVAEFPRPPTQNPARPPGDARNGHRPKARR